MRLLLNEEEIGNAIKAALTGWDVEGVELTISGENGDKVEAVVTAEIKKAKPEKKGGK
jgi:hypothetical protein